MQTTPYGQISFRFEGGDADEGQLNFYDASRFEYGTARFIYTLEHFRQTGKVLQRVTERVNADFRVPTLRRGSWIMDVLHLAAPPMAEVAIKVPLEVLMAFVMERLTPSSRSRDMAREAAVVIERERTAQERERTEQLRLMTETNSKALDLVARMMDRVAAGESAQVQLLKEIRDEISAGSVRDTMLEHHRDELGKIDSARLVQMVDRARSQVAEMGKPLIRSADRLAITSGSRPTDAFVSLSRRSVEQLGGRTIDQLPTTSVLCSMRHHGADLAGRLLA